MSVARAVLAWLGLAALAGCGGATPASGELPGGTPRAGAGESPGRSERLICPRCYGAGGETSDFGDGGQFMPTGAGTGLAQTPCELSTTVSSIELDAARALGFGDLLDRLETEFDVPFVWTPSEEDLDRPARGYAPSTRVRGQLRALSARHHVPSIEGCADSLSVEVAARLETQDGALSTSGTLHATIERGAERPTADGWLDLSQARGTLELDLPESSDDLVVGYVRVFLYAWPDGMRLSLAIGADHLDFHYQPLEARAPLDDCAPSARPLAFDEPTRSIDADDSLSARYPELLSTLSAPQPFRASWMGGAETALDIAVGEPLVLCDEAGALSGRVPYRARSSDGRLDIDTQARMSVRFDADGALASGSFEIAEPGSVHPAESFAETTGISGVDFGDHRAARWQSQLLFETASSQPPSGQITVEAAASGDAMPGSSGEPAALLDSLAW